MGNAVISSMSGKKILLVDDDPAFVRAMSIKLCAEGHEVVTAEDGAAAVSALRQGKPDLILLDILYPPDVAHGGGVAWDGFLLADWLRRMGGAADTPVIFITAADPAQYVERARRAGAAGLLPKTLEASEMMRVIQRVLDRAALAS
jgi:CheY-like chemotaxis protein